MVLHKTGADKKIIEAGKSALSKVLGKNKAGDAGSVENLKNVKLNDLGKEKASQTTKKTVLQDTRKIDPTTGLKYMDHPMSTEEHLKAVNLSHSQDNCKQVSQALGERLANNRDADTAVRQVGGNGSNIKAHLEKDILRHAQEGDAGAVNVTFDHKYLRKDAPQDAHAFNWQVKDGKVNWMDGQGNRDGSARTQEDIDTFFKKMDSNKAAEWVNYKGRQMKGDCVGKTIQNRALS